MTRRYKTDVRGLHAAVGRMLRHARESTGKSREVFSGLIGVSRRKLDRVERGESKATAELVAKVLAGAEWSCEIVAGPRRELEQQEALRRSPPLGLRRAS